MAKLNKLTFLINHTLLLCKPFYSWVLSIKLCWLWTSRDNIWNLSLILKAIVDLAVRMVRILIIMSTSCVNDLNGLVSGIAWSLVGEAELWLLLLNHLSLIQEVTYNWLLLWHAISIRIMLYCVIRVLYLFLIPSLFISTHVPTSLPWWSTWVVATSRAIAFGASSILFHCFYFFLNYINLYKKFEFKFQNWSYNMKIYYKL